MATKTWKKKVGKCLATPASKALFSSCLFFALFGGGFWQLCDFADDPSNAILDTLMTLVFIGFCVEIALNLIVDSNYFLSFFFFMDVVGTVSMMFEVSYLLGNAGNMDSKDTAIDPVFMRTARVAKTAARAGRFLKLTKCLDIIIRPGQRQKDNADTAKLLSSKLMLSLSTRVSLLTIALVVVIPLFQIGQYPEEDLSMKAWGQRLEESYARSYNTLAADTSQNSTTIFYDVVEEMRSFYSSINYFPYQVSGYPEELVLDGRVVSIPGASLLADEEMPLRLQNVVKQEVSDCLISRSGCAGGSKAAAFFNFGDAKRREDGSDMAMSLFVIMIMAGLTTNLSSTIDRVVVKPLERMLGMVREVGATIIKLTEDQDVRRSGTFSEIDADVHEDVPDETILLERAFEKLSRITSIALQNNVIDTKDMTDEARGVFVDLMNMQAKPIPGSISDMTSGSPTPTSPQLGRVAKLPVPLEKAESWEMDMLSLSLHEREQVLVHIFFDSGIGCVSAALYTDPEMFHKFYECTMAGYLDLQYHNAIHAADVTHVVYRLLSLVQAEQWVSEVDLFALLVAAMCHDMGHMGRTNPFLVETGHELALRYNDASPLENMHSASLFQVCSKPETNIFKALAPDQFKKARKTSIAAILHTDNAHHFDMVKTVNQLYEVSSDVIEKQAKQGDKGGLLPPYQCDVLQKESITYLQLFLHLADISNPLKPFTMSEAWAKRVVAEFFDQGDEEKQLGIPVGMLNDRDKTSLPGSQHGFINFLVAPLVFGTIKLLPFLHPLATQMAENLREYRNSWVAEAKPDEEAISKRDADVDKAREKADELRLRVQQDLLAPPEVGKSTSRIHPWPSNYSVASPSPSSSLLRLSGNPRPPDS